VKANILFLCTELAGYLINCIEEVRKNVEGEIRVVHWPANSVAPFEHEMHGIIVVNKSDVKPDKLIQQCIQFKPQLVYVAGWMDNDYLVICKALKHKGTIVVNGLDNPWKGTMRQRMLCAMSTFKIKPYYNYFWVAGYKQFQFARNLGYDVEHILQGLYVADIYKFLDGGKTKYSPYLVFVGRLEEIKGIKFLCEVFSALSEDERNGWQLRCIGNGSLRNNLQLSPHILVEDFMQPDRLKDNTKDAGGFILPSFEEHWGVVVQEFAASGLPLILSDAVNAGEEFLIHGYNGFKFKNKDKDDLRQCLIRFFKETPEQLRTMGSRSRQLAISNTPELWSARFLSLLYHQNR
jgi:glycosyltransferase involved in cell wall biosynthesis